MNKLGTLKVIPFSGKHLDLLEARDYEKKCIIPYLNSDFLNVMEDAPHCYTMIGDGRIITCMGIMKLWDGVGEIWQLPSIYVKDHMREYCQFIKQKMDEVSKDLKLWRMQTISPADGLHERWMQFLGFECEGLMKNYTRFKTDCFRWSKGF